MDAQTAFESKVSDGTTHVLVDSGTVDATEYRGVTITAVGECRVIAGDGVRVLAHDCAHVEARPGSSVIARGRSVVNACDGATVEAREHSTVSASSRAVCFVGADVDLYYEGSDAFIYALPEEAGEAYVVDGDSDEF